MIRVNMIQKLSAGKKKKSARRQSTAIRIARPAIFLAAMALAVLAGLTGALGYRHVIERDSALYHHPVLWTLAATLTIVLLALAMYGVWRDSPRFFGVFQMLAGCALFWNAIAVTMQHEMETGNAYQSAYFLKILVAIFLVMDGYKDYERAAPK